jgi:Flp pilus assembly protein TadB
MGAVTRGDLHGLFDDLPPLADDPEPRPDRPRRGRRLATTGLAVLVVLAASAVVSTGVHLVVHGVWLALVVTGVVLLVRSRRRTC